MKKIIICMLIVSVLFTYSCKKNEDKPKPTVTTAPMEKDDLNKTTKPKETGKPEVISKFKRPIAVMIDNQGKVVLPQGGLLLADIVYEIPVEENITRYMALFTNSLPDMIGPVRSVRSYFYDYLLESDSILVHIGYSPKAQEEIKTFDITNMNGLMNLGKGFFDITNDPNNWQDTYTSGEEINKYLSENKIETITKQGLPLKYAETEYIPQNTAKIDYIEIKYSKENECAYYYNGDDKIYLRMRMRVPQKDRNTSSSILVKNIIIHYTDIVPIEGDTEGRLDVVTTGSGNGWYLSNGKAVAILWEKPTRDAPTVYKTIEGKELEINPGNTWIHILSYDTEINFK